MKKSAKKPSRALDCKQLATVQERDLVLAVGSSGYLVGAGEDGPPPDPPT